MLTVLGKYWNSINSLSFKEFYQKSADSYDFLQGKAKSYETLTKYLHDDRCLESASQKLKSYFFGKDIWDDLYEYVYYIIDEVRRNIDEYVIVPITRKGYWLFKVVSESMDISNDIILKTDRYINKALDDLIFKNRTVILIDDTLTHGDYLIDFYTRLKNRVDSIKLIPYIFYLNSEYKFGANKERKKFDGDLRYFRKMNTEDLSEFCTYEMALFHELLIPYTIDIPILKTGNKHKDYFTFLNNAIIIDKDKLDVLFGSNSEWQYEDYSYSIREMGIRSGFFSLRNTYLYSECSWLLQNFVIKLRYKYISNDRALVSFTPFVLMRSIDVRALLDLFVILYRPDKLKKDKLEDDKPMYMMELIQAFANHHISLSTVPYNLYVALYRAIVYRLSLYIWLLFEKSMLKNNNINCKWLLNDEIMKDNCDKVFIDDNQLFYKKYSAKGYKTILVDLYNKLNIPIYSSINTEKESFADYTYKFSNRAFDYDKCLSVLHLRWLDSKRENLQKSIADDSNMQSHIKVEKEIEDVETHIDNYYKLNMPFQKKVQVSKMILQMLDMSIISNQIDYNKPIVRRGFKFGENSDLFFFFNIQYVYAGIRGFVEKIINIAERASDNSEKICEIVNTLYRHNIDNAMIYIRRHLKEMGLMNAVMSQTDYDFSYYYFKNISSEVKTQIQNKSYLYDKSNILHKSIHDYALSREYKVEKAWLK